FSELYQQSRERMFVNSDLVLRAQLTEFKDHKLLRQRRGPDGAELLHVPLSASSLRDFLE
ncbi:Origin recognition complex subunit 2, partial [Trinorchestia longiramus]